MTTKFFLDSANLSLPTDIYNNEKLLEVSQGSATTVSQNIIAGSTNIPFAVWSTAAAAHNNLDWPSTGWSVSYDVSTAGADLTWNGFIARYAAGGTSLRTSAALVNPQSGTGIKTASFTWTLVNNHVSRAATDILGVTIENVANSNMMTTETLAINVGDADSWAQNLSLSQSTGTPVGKDLQLVWNVAQPPVGKNLQLVWNTKTFVGKSNQLVWRVLTSVEKSLQTIWNTRAPVGKSLQTIWNTRAPVGKSLQTIWNTRAPVGKSLQLVWNVFTFVGKVLGLVWNVKAAVGKSMQVVWDVLFNSGSAIGKDLALQWSVRSTVSKDLGIVWNVAQPVGKNLQLVWNVRERVLKTLTIQYNILKVVRALTPGTDVLSAGYNNEFTSDVSGWAVGTGPALFTWSSGAARLEKTGANFYATIGATAVDVPAAAGPYLVWVRARAGSSFQGYATLWNDGSTGFFTMELTTSWQDFYFIHDHNGTKFTDLELGSNVTIPVGSWMEFDFYRVSPLSDLDLRWNVIGPINKDLDLRWNVLTPVAKSLQLIWLVLTPVSKSVQFLWNILTPVGKVNQLVWNVLSNTFTAAKELGLVWNTKATVNKDLDLRWRLRGLVDKAVVLRWNVFTSAGKSADLRWNTRAPAGKSLQTVWNTRAVVQNPLTIRYNVLTFIGKSLDIRWRTLTLVGKSLQGVWHVRAPSGRDLTLVWNTKINFVWTPVPPDSQLWSETTPDIQSWDQVIPDSELWTEQPGPADGRSGINLLPVAYSAFETADPVGWGAFFGQMGAISKSTVRAHTGTTSMRLDWRTSTPDGQDIAFFNLDNWKDNARYRLSAWVYSPAGTPLVRPSGLFQSEDTLEYLHTAHDQWDYVSCTFKHLPGGSIAIGFANIGASVGSQSAWVDDIRVEEISSDVTTVWDDNDPSATIWN